MKNFKKFVLVASTAAALSSSAAVSASVFTDISPYGVNVTTVGATTVGGIVIDLVGTNGAHVVSQVAANTLYSGFPTVSNTTIGSQAGYGAAVTNALGGGLASAAFRFTLLDGDTAAGEFDFNKVSLLVNNITFGNWSSVITQTTDGFGVAAAGALSSGGFRNDKLDTGWFASSDAALLSSLYTSLLSTQALSFVNSDSTPNDNQLDFNRGLNGSLINVGQAPVVASAVPEPASFALFGLGLLGFAAARRRKN